MSELAATLKPIEERKLDVDNWLQLLIKARDTPPTVTSVDVMIRAGKLLHAHDQAFVLKLCAALKFTREDKLKNVYMSAYNPQVIRAWDERIAELLKGAET